MSLSYKHLSRYPQVFLRASGVTKDIFDEILKKLKPLWDKEIIGTYKRPGRHFKMALEDIVLMTFIYYRTYSSMVWIGFLFGLNESNVSRLIGRAEPLLAKIMTINKEKMLTKEDLEACLIDATEQKTQRPSTTDQKPFYSGKKKQHTIKTEIKTTPKGKITNVSKSVPGATHDYALRKSEPELDEGQRAYVDSGYQGLQNVHAATELPFKASKKKPLDEESKEYNTALSRIRVMVENVLGDIKIFGIMKDVYRNPRKTYNQKFVVMAGLVNARNGFGI